MRGSGTVVAVERSGARASKLKEACAHLECILVAHADSTKLCVKWQQQSHHLSLGPALEEYKTGGGKPCKLVHGLPPASFDRVVLDPPCSGRANHSSLAAHM